MGQRPRRGRWPMIPHRAILLSHFCFWPRWDPLRKQMIHPLFWEPPFLLSHFTCLFVHLSLRICEMIDIRRDTARTHRCLIQLVYFHSKFFSRLLNDSIIDCVLIFWGNVKFWIARARSHTAHLHFYYFPCPSASDYLLAVYQALLLLIFLFIVFLCCVHVTP